MTRKMCVCVFFSLPSIFSSLLMLCLCYYCMQEFVEINLSKNEIGGKGVKCLTDLIHYSKVEDIFLFIRFCLLISLYKFFQQLSALLLGYNRIEHTGMHYLSSALQENKVITDIKILLLYIAISLSK